MKLALPPKVWVEPLQWMAPELFTLRPKHNKKSDIYSLGITFWEIVARQIPYQGAAERGVVQDSSQRWRTRRNSRRLSQTIIHAYYKLVGKVILPNVLIPMPLLLI